MSTLKINIKNKKYNIRKRLIAMGINLNLFKYLGNAFRSVDAFKYADTRSNSLIRADLLIAHVQIR